MEQLFFCLLRRQSGYLLQLCQLLIVDLRYFLILPVQLFRSFVDLLFLSLQRLPFSLQCFFFLNDSLFLPLDLASPLLDLFFKIVFHAQSLFLRFQKDFPLLCIRRF